MYIVEIQRKGDDDELLTIGLHLATVFKKNHSNI